MNSTMNFVTDIDMKLIMKRYDKNNDGKITFQEFLEEVNPVIIH